MSAQGSHQIHPDPAVCVLIEREVSAANAEIARLRARVAELEAEGDDLICRVCSAAVRDGRGGRLGLPLLWRALTGGAA